MAAEEKRKFEQLELNSDIFAFQAVENHIDLKRVIGNAASTLQAAVLHHNIEPDDEEKGRTRYSWLKANLRRAWIVSC